MNDCDALLRAVMGQAKALSIPFSAHVDPHVTVNARAVSRFGCCKYRDGAYVIELALRVAQGPEAACRETLAHELLHTCYGCRNHGKRWRGYAEKMNAAYGYHIRRTSTGREMGLEEREYRYMVRCSRCGAEFGRFRASALVEYPERYRCRCGGHLKRVM